MEKRLLSVDWDYFIYCKSYNWESYLENKKSVIDLWYKRYLQLQAKGKNIKNYFQLSADVDQFWQKIKRVFKFKKGIKAYVSDSHALSYYIAKNNQCQAVYLFDAHADLGYGGLPSLNFELNCANWLGKLLKDKLITKAVIVYSPFTTEKAEYFKEINNCFNIQYCHLTDLQPKIEISAIHVCRSGAWTPPWFDNKFKQFVNQLGVPYQTIDCPPRKWNPKNISTAEYIYYLLA